MKTRDVVLALDQGSSSSRALAFDARGRVVARAQFPVRARYPAPGRVEHDALELARTLERALDRVLDALPRSATVAAVGLSSQRSTVVLWDAESGRPAAAAPSWQDSRAAEGLKALAADPALMGRVHERTGLYLNPYYSAPKVKALLESTPAARELAAKGRLRVGPVSSWVLWRLTGGAVFRVDPTMAQRTLLYDLARGDWDDELLRLFGVERSWLPSVGPSAGPQAAFTRRGRALRVTACLGDQQAAALGQGAAEEGSAVLNYGTGAFFLLNTGATLARVPGLLSSAAWQETGGPCRYFLEGTVHAAGTSLDWLSERLGVLGDPRRADAACRRASGGVMALPAIGGLGAPHWDYATPTVFYGLTAGSTGDDLVRGVVEGLAMLVADGVEAARTAGHAVSAFTAGGGLSRLDWLLQFQADALGARITRLEEPEATARGAAELAAKAAGVVLARPRRNGRVFSPRLSREESARLRARWTRFLAAQRALARELS